MQKIIFLLVLLPLLVKAQSNHKTEKQTANLAEVMQSFSTTEQIAIGWEIAKNFFQSDQEEYPLPIRPFSKSVENDSTNVDYVIVCNEKSCFILNNYNLYKKRDFLTLEFDKMNDNVIVVKKYSKKKASYFVVKIWFDHDSASWHYAYRDIESGKKMTVRKGTKLHFAH